MLCQICTMVQKSIVTASSDDKRAKLIQAYTEHLKRDHHATKEEIDAHLSKLTP